MGMRVFVTYFREFANPDIPTQSLINLLPNDYTLNSRRTRITNARRIFREGMQDDALRIVASSENVEPEAAAIARAILRSGL
jgi:hypothetical protein